jgi:hypothetical protein
MTKGSRQKLPGAFVVNRSITQLFQGFGGAFRVGSFGPVIASHLGEQKAPGSQNDVGTP